MLQFKTKKAKNSYISALNKIYTAVNSNNEIDDRGNVLMNLDSNDEYSISCNLSLFVQTKFSINIPIGNTKPSTLILSKDLLNNLKLSETNDIEFAISDDRVLYFNDNYIELDPSDSLTMTTNKSTIYQFSKEIISKDYVKIKKEMENSGLTLFSDKHTIPSPLFNLLNGESSGRLNIRRNEEKFIDEFELTFSLDNDYSVNNVARIYHFIPGDKYVIPNVK